MQLREIAVPTENGQRYWKSHYLFFIRLARAAGIQVDEILQSSDSHNGFVIHADSLKILIDYSDHLNINSDLKSYNICFKYHYSDDRHWGLRTVYPLTPISFYDWNQYFRLQKYLKYKCNSDIILNNQKPGAAAKERRSYVQAILKDRYGEKLDNSITTQTMFWRKIANCLVSVCVPGARNDILDRGQFQYWAFGACTISPKLNIVLPYMRQPEPDFHYIECKSDYSDLIEIIEWCRGHRIQCQLIGDNAKRLFLETSTPQKIWSWMEQCTVGIS